MKIPSLRLIPSVILLILRLRVKLKDNVFQQWDFFFLYVLFRIIISSEAQRTFVNVLFFPQPTLIGALTQLSLFAFKPALILQMN